MEQYNLNKPIKVILYVYLMHRGPLTGYQIAKDFKQFMKNDNWTVPNTQNLKHHSKIYPILNEMEESRLLKSEPGNSREYRINPMVALGYPVWGGAYENDKDWIPFEDIFYKDNWDRAYSEDEEYANFLLLHNPLIESLPEVTKNKTTLIKMIDKGFNAPDIDYLSVLLYFRDLITFTNSTLQMNYLEESLPIDIERYRETLRDFLKSTSNDPSVKKGNKDFIGFTLDKLNTSIDLLLSQISPLYRMGNIKK